MTGLSYIEVYLLGLVLTTSLWICYTLGYTNPWRIKEYLRASRPVTRYALKLFWYVSLACFIGVIITASILVLRTIFGFPPSTQPTQHAYQWVLIYIQFGVFYSIATMPATALYIITVTLEEIYDESDVGRMEHYD